MEKNNKAIVKAGAKIYRERESEKIYALQKEWTSKNKDKVNEKSRRFYLSHREEMIAKSRKYYKNNPEKVAALSAGYRAKKKSACPKWLSKEDKKRISDLYKTRNLLTSETGIQK